MAEALAARHDPATDIPIGPFHDRLNRFSLRFAQAHSGSPRLFQALLLGDQTRHETIR